MQTVKHIADGTGKETLVEAAVVEFSREENCLIAYESVIPMVEAARWSSGHAYVMNENGKTVAVYNITLKVK